MGGIFRSSDIEQRLFARGDHGALVAREDP